MDAQEENPEDRDDLEAPAPRWHRVDEAPALPAAVPDLGPGAWWLFEGDDPEDDQLYALVQGDGGAGGAYRVTLVTIDPWGGPVRFPTLEMALLAFHELTTLGVIMQAQLIAVPGELSHPVQLVQWHQVGAVQGSPALTRALLAGASRHIQAVR